MQTLNDNFSQFFIPNFSLCICVNVLLLCANSYIGCTLHMRKCQPSALNIPLLQGVQLNHNSANNGGGLCAWGWGDIIFCFLSLNLRS